MGYYRITVVNDEFSAEDEEEHADEAAAVGQALKGALEVGVEQVLAGQSFFGAEVTVDDGETRQRFVVAVGVSPLK